MEYRYGRKRSGIKKELTEKINEWLDSIEDKDVRKIAEGNVIVTGGSIASMLLGEKVNDYDLYFKTIDATEAVAKYYVEKYKQVRRESDNSNVDGMVIKREVLENIKGEREERIIAWIESSGVAGERLKQKNPLILPEDGHAPFQELEGYSEEELAKALERLLREKANTKEKYVPTFISQNAIALTGKIQIIIRFYGEPEQIHNNYDFVHAKCYWDHKNKKLELPAEALESMLSRTLIYRGSLYPIASIFRMKKFLERGWRISAGQQLKIMWQISKIDLSNVAVLRDQLTGVDLAYMSEIIGALKDVDSESINSTYVGKIIDRIFD